MKGFWWKAGWGYARQPPKCKFYPILTTCRRIKQANPKWRLLLLECHLEINFSKKSIFVVSPLLTVGYVATLSGRFGDPTEV